jgi:hypothetical protein
LKPSTASEIASAGEHAHPPGALHVALGGVEHAAPAAQVGVAEAEEAEARLEQDRLGDVERGDHDHRRQHVGQDLDEDDAPGAHADDAGAVDVGQRAVAQELAAHEPGRLRPAEDADHQDEVDEPRAEEGDDDQRQHEARDDLEELGDAHEQLVGPAAEVAATAPTRMPMTVAVKAAASPTISDTRAPQITPESTSRPRWSVPSRCPGVPGGWSAAREVVKGSSGRARARAARPAPAARPPRGRRRPVRWRRN